MWFTKVVSSLCCICLVVGFTYIHPDDPTMEVFISRTLYFNRLPPDSSEETLKSLCEPYGDPRKISVQPHKHIAWVEFHDIRAAERARSALKGSIIEGKTIDVQYSRTRDDRLIKDTNQGTLYIRPISAERDFHDPNPLEKYKELFGSFGDIKKISTNRKREAEKFVEYYDLRAAEASMTSLNGFKFNGVELEIQYAHFSSKTLNRDSKLRDALPTRVSSRQLESPTGYAPYRSHPNPSSGAALVSPYDCPSYTNFPFPPWTCPQFGRFVQGSTLTSPTASSTQPY